MPRTRDGLSKLDVRREVMGTVLLEGFDGPGLDDDDVLAEQIEGGNRVSRTQGSMKLRCSGHNDGRVGGGLLRQPSRSRGEHE